MLFPISKSHLKLSISLDDEKFLILWARVWLANEIIAFCLSGYHVLVCGFAKIERVCL